MVKRNISNNYKNKEIEGILFIFHTTNLTWWTFNIKTFGWLPSLIGDNNHTSDSYDNIFFNRSLILDNSRSCILFETGELHASPHKCDDVFNLIFNIQNINYRI